MLAQAMVRSPDALRGPFPSQGDAFRTSRSPARPTRFRTTSSGHRVEGACSTSRGDAIAVDDPNRSRNTFYQSITGLSPIVAQGAARSSDLDSVRDETPKLLELARSPASALPARPSVLHRCAS